jgi:hypothetical protein
MLRLAAQSMRGRIRNRREEEGRGRKRKKEEARVADVQRKRRDGR